MNSRGKKNTRFAYAVDSPLVIYLAAVLIYPLLWGLYISFTSKTIGGPANFTGLKNYQKLLGDPEYRRSIMNTVVFTALSIAFKTFFGMLMALVNRRAEKKGKPKAALEGCKGCPHAAACAMCELPGEQTPEDPEKKEAATV